MARAPFCDWRGSTRRGRCHTNRLTFWPWLLFFFDGRPPHCPLQTICATNSRSLFPPSTPWSTPSPTPVAVRGAPTQPGPTAKALPCRLRLHAATCSLPLARSLDGFRRSSLVPLPASSTSGRRRPDRPLEPARVARSQLRLCSVSSRNRVKASPPDDSLPRGHRREITPPWKKLRRSP